MDCNNSNNNHWVAGFVSGEGCFFIQISKSKTHKLGISVALNFFVDQNIRDSYLLASFTQVFGCGSLNIVEKSGIVNFSVKRYNFSDITDKIYLFLKSIIFKELKLNILMILKKHLF